MQTNKKMCLVAGSAAIAFATFGVIMAEAVFGHGFAKAADRRFANIVRRVEFRSESDRFWLTGYLFDAEPARSTARGDRHARLRRADCTAWRAVESGIWTGGSAWYARVTWLCSPTASARVVTDHCAALGRAR